MLTVTFAGTKTATSPCNVCAVTATPSKRSFTTLANPVTKEFHDELSNKVIAAFKNAVTATNNQQEAKAASTAIKR